MDNIYSLLFRNICFKPVEIWYFFTFILSFENDVCNEWISLPLQNQQLMGNTLQKQLFPEFLQIGVLKNLTNMKVWFYAFSLQFYYIQHMWFPVYTVKLLRANFF